MMKHQEQPLVSVIMAVYNGEKFVSESINSVLDQSYKNIELIVVDDLSNDNTKGILKNFENDTRIKVIHNTQNLGLTKSLNVALGVASGYYIARLDADDIALKDRILKQVNYLSHNPEVVCLGTASIIINENGNQTGQKNVLTNARQIVFRSIYANQITHSSVMFIANKIKSIGGYNEEFKYAQDFELWSRCLQSGYVIANLNEPLIKYRLHSNSITQGQNTKDKAYNFALKIIEDNIKNTAEEALKHKDIFIDFLHSKIVRNISSIIKIYKFLHILKINHMNRQRSGTENEVERKEISADINHVIYQELKRAINWYIRNKLSILRK